MLPVGKFHKIEVRHGYHIGITQLAECVSFNSLVYEVDNDIFILRLASHRLFWNLIVGVYDPVNVVVDGQLLFNKFSKFFAQNTLQDQPIVLF